MYSGEGSGGFVQPSLRRIHGNGCRCPPYTSLLGAFVVTGIHQLILMTFLLIPAYQGIQFTFYLKESVEFRVVYYSALVYSMFDVSRLYSQFTASRRVEIVMQNGVLHFVPTFLTIAFVTIGTKLFYGFWWLPHWTVIVHFVGGGVISVIFALVSGWCHHTNYTACPTIKIPQQSHSNMSWNSIKAVDVLVGGLVPLGVISYWMDEMYTSVWSLESNVASNNLVGIFIFIMLYTIISTLSLSYFQLTHNDHTWWWRTFFRTSSLAGFIFAYGIWFIKKTNIPGVQPLLFFGYSACICYAFALAMGTAAFTASGCLYSAMYRRPQAEHIV